MPSTTPRGPRSADWLTVATLLVALPAGCASPERASPEPTATTFVYLVRHAEKASERGDAELTEAGKRRASTLMWMLHDVQIDAVYSTNFRRTRDTAAPAAAARDLDVTIYTSNDELIQTLRKKHAGQTVLVCGHSNTIPRMLSELGVPIRDEILPGYDDLFVVALRWRSPDTKPQATLQRLHYARTWEP